MHYTIELFQKGMESDWDKYVKSANNGTIFHERLFLSYHPPTRFTENSLIFKSKGKIIALFPAARKIIGKEKYLISHPGASFGGFVYKDIGIKQAFWLVEDLIMYARREGFTYISLTIPPIIYSYRYNNYIEFALLQNSFHYKKREISSVIQLNFGIDDIQYQFKNETRTALRKARKMGVKVRLSSDFDTYYEILKHNLKMRHNVTATHSLDELKKLAKLYPDRIFLLSAYLNEKMIAGVINFICNRNVILVFYISHNNKYQEYRPVNLLFYETMKWAIEANIKFLDFGIFTVNMKPNWGLGKFKESFGARGIFRDTFEYITNL